MLPLLRKLGSIAATFVFGTFLLWSGQVGPEDAWANWQKWLKWFGIENVPAWLNSQTFLSWVSAAGGAFVGAALVLLYTVWRRQKDLNAPLVPILSTDPEFISMKEAATQAYETFRRGGGLGKLAPDELSQTDPLSWCASFLIVKDIPVYGAHPPSRDRERIPKRDLRHLHVENDCNELHEVMSSRNPIWKDLEVRVEDLEPGLDAIKRDYSE
jgi:hypothetical protein